MITTISNLTVLALLLLGTQESKYGDVTPLSQEALAKREMVATPNELRCVGFIGDMLPMDIHISATDQEESKTYVMEGSPVYLNGAGLRSVRAGEIFRVVRAEGKVHEPRTRKSIGVYYRELGTVRIESAREDSATGTVLSSCDVMFKGDILLPLVEKTTVRYPGETSNRLTPHTAGLTSSIVLGKNDLTRMATGHVCFIAVGGKDGVKLGDRFTIYRVQPSFDPKHLAANRSHSGTSYRKITAGGSNADAVETLKKRKIPPIAIGDLVVVDVAQTTAVAKIVHSRSEVYLGDIIVRQ